jgi:hypothetical protein
VDDALICGSCGRPINDGDAVVLAQPMIEMRTVDDRRVLVGGLPRTFHADHLPAGDSWRPLTTDDGAIAML